MLSHIRVLFIVLIATSFILHGCVSTKIGLVKDDFDSIKRVKIVRSTSPEFRVHGASNLLAIAPVINLINIPIDNAASNDAKKSALPDIGELLTKSFASQIKGAIPSWTEIDIEATPVGMSKLDGYKYENGNLLALKPLAFELHFSKGLCVGAHIQMRSNIGKVIFNDLVIYCSGEHGDKKSSDEYLADGGKLLVEGMQIATDQLAKDTIKSLRESNPI